MKIPQGITLTKLESMTPSAARKIIAQDCLQWLELEKIVPSNGIYIGFEAEIGEDDKPAYYEGGCKDFYQLSNDDEIPAHVLIEQMPEEVRCQVCALGLATIASVCRFNEVKAVELEASSSVTRRYLEKFFPVEQIYMMECAFEGWDAYILFDSFFPPPDHANEKLNAFHKKYFGGRDRLRAIFQNIVDNEGEFILPDVPNKSEDSCRSLCAVLRGRG